MRKSSLSSIYRIWVTSLIYGAEFNMAFVPPSFDLSRDSLLCGTDEMKLLYQLGYEESLAETAWHTQTDPADPQELLELLDPMTSIDELEARPDLRPDDLD